ncbi:MAG: bile acid:sodium symporter family protein [Bacteroidales bacterium]|nr:bile acid:sodium symporter family protein [Bacteroidales bacterium]
MLEQLQALDNININFSPESLHIVNLILALVMYGVALGIRPQTFKNVLLFPKSAFVGLFAQAIALPAITFLLVVLLNNWITPMIAMGMILVASCPGGNMSNFMSQLSRGNTELSISLTAIGTVITPILTPFNFWLWGSFYTNFVNNQAGEAIWLRIPFLDTFKLVLLLLGIPLLLGILTVRYFPKIARKIKKPLQNLSVALFLILIVVAFSNNLDIFWSPIFIFIFILVLVHNSAVLGTGYGLATLFKLPPKDRRALTIETGIQNSGLGLVLLFNLMNRGILTDPIGGMLVVTAWWGIWHIISGLLISFYWSRRAAR